MPDTQSDGTETLSNATGTPIDTPASTEASYNSALEPPLAENSEASKEGFDTAISTPTLTGAPEVLAKDLDVTTESPGICIKDLEVSKNAELDRNSVPEVRKSDRDSGIGFVDGETGSVGF